MMGDTAVVANAVLAAAFGTLALALAASYFTHRLPGSGVARAFLGWLWCMCVLRCIQLAIPNQALGLGEEPQDDLPRFSRVWWANVFRFAVYVGGNSASMCQFVWLLKLADAALGVVDTLHQQHTRITLAVGLVTYSAWQVWLVLSNLVVRYNVALLMSSASAVLIVLVVLAGFLHFWAHLWRSMALVTKHRTACDSMRDVCAQSTWCCGLRRMEIESLPLHDSSQMHNTQSARRKLGRFTLLAAAYTSAAVLKTAVLAYMSAMVVRGAFASQDSAAFSSWWIVVVVDFSATELILTGLVMLALWRHPTERKDTRCGAVAVAMPVGKYDRLVVPS